VLADPAAARASALATGELIECSTGCGTTIRFDKAHLLEIDGKEIKVCDTCCPFCVYDDADEEPSPTKYVTCRLRA
jgi:ribosome-binding protein aMBF1 (putative translation factor)